jgi:hypothetical protein
MQLPPTIISIDKKVKEKKEANVKRIEKALGDKKRLGEKEKDRESGKATETAPQATSNVEISDGESGDEKTPDDEDTLSVDTNLERQAEKGRKLSKLRPPRTLETTLFDRLERMYGPRIKRMLDVQYRYAYALIDRWAFSWNKRIRSVCMEASALFLRKRCTQENWFPTNLSGRISCAISPRSRRNQYRKKIRKTSWARPWYFSIPLDVNISSAWKGMVTKAVVATRTKRSW